ncbi:hypothetical protein Emag_001299 [Eimeria magna]
MGSRFTSCAVGPSEATQSQEAAAVTANEQRLRLEAAFRKLRGASTRAVP